MFGTWALVADKLSIQLEGYKKHFWVTFTKKDGTDRVMECTTNTDLVPLVEEKVHYTNTDNPIDFPKVKKVNDEVMPVYDLEAKGWRSFRWDSVKQVTLKIGEEREYDTSPQWSLWS